MSLPGIGGGVPAGECFLSGHADFHVRSDHAQSCRHHLLLLTNRAAAQNPNYYDFEALPHTPASGQAFQLRVALSALSCLRLPESIIVTPLAGNAVQIYRGTHNLRAVQLLLGNTTSESTVRYLGTEVDDTLEIAELSED